LLTRIVTDYVAVEHHPNNQHNNTKTKTEFFVDLAISAALQYGVYTIDDLT